jgi:hypothetical protein
MLGLTRTEKLKLHPFERFECRLRCCFAGRNVQPKSKGNVLIELESGSR